MMLVVRANRRKGAIEMAAQVDPVCGMQVDEQTAAGRSEHEGRTYYFCSAGCKEKFDQDPGRYAKSE
jgi:YHS domain-containing protein